MPFPRAAGVLLHPTSLPGPYGIGDLGQAAYDFVDFLKQSALSLWQILPLGPTGYGDSPYQSFSSFAGNPLLISPEMLVANGYLPATALGDVPPFPADRVDYGPVIDYKTKLLRAAFQHFQEHGTPAQRKELAEFADAEAGWLADFALYMALKNHHADHHGGVWVHWPKELVQRDPDALRQWSERLATEVAYQKFAQFLFYGQWLRLKSYANENGIKVIGDVPIFVAFDSAEVWANQQLFQLDPDGFPTVVAGVPPDYFSETGQRWGNPLYRWSLMAENGYAWWTSRLRMCLTQTDIVRIDHFRGFEAYWAIPADEETAMNGRWRRGPGAPFFEKMRETLGGELPIIAEDLGVITQGVADLRDGFGFPGMRILQFGFGGERNNEFLPHNFEKNAVVYTGTHDNTTTKGWYQQASEEEKDHVRRYVSADGHDIAWNMIRLAWASVADMAVAPMQDLLNIGDEGRMNFPGRLGGNWQWRFRAEQLADWIPWRLHDITELFGRAPYQQEEKAYDSIDIDE